MLNVGPKAAMSAEECTCSTGVCLISMPTMCECTGPREQKLVSITGLGHSEHPAGRQASGKPGSPLMKQGTDLGLMQLLLQHLQALCRSRLPGTCFQSCHGSFCLHLHDMLQCQKPGLQQQAISLHIVPCLHHELPSCAAGQVLCIKEKGTIIAR